MAKRIKKVSQPEEPQGSGKAKAGGTAGRGKVPGSRAQVIKNLLVKVEEKMAADAGKATVGDYIRLVQLHKELDVDEPKEIKVTWVEPETEK
jgi:hypothetical protein